MRICRLSEKLFCLLRVRNDASKCPISQKGLSFGQCGKRIELCLVQKFPSTSLAFLASNRMQYKRISLITGDI